MIGTDVGEFPITHVGQKILLSETLPKGEYIKTKIILVAPR
jgi:hypothetical protein